tara:strand:+ start:2984 stop:3484 length:501 start_codon:yes stop_codon:yes gene_type:complete
VDVETINQQTKREKSKMSDYLIHQPDIDKTNKLRDDNGEWASVVHPWGYEKFDINNFKKYYTVAVKVREDGGLTNQDGTPWTVDSIDRVFSILNGTYYDDDSNTDIVDDHHVHGYQTFTGTGGNKYRKMRSMSVGDIVEKDGSFFFCDNTGWKDITDEINSIREVA